MWNLFLKIQIHRKRVEKKLLGVGGKGKKEDGKRIQIFSITWLKSEDLMYKHSDYSW